MLIELVTARLRIRVFSRHFAGGGIGKTMGRVSRIGAWGTLGLALVLAGCAGQPTAISSSGPYPNAKGYILGAPYQVDGVWYHPHLSPHYDKTGIASWYGIPFEGRLTADGEVYNQNALTAASPTLPLPSYVRVTDLQNGRSIVLRVNDRGPFVNGRLLDVTRRAAQLLGFEEAGTAEVRVQAVPGPSGTPIPGTSNVMVASRQSAPAAAPAANLAPAYRTDAATATPSPTSGTATIAIPHAMSAGPVQMAALPPEGAADPSTSGSATSPVLPATTSSTQVGHWVAQDANLAATLRQEPVHPTHIFIQAGAFESYGNANHLRQRLTRIGTVQVTRVTVRGIQFYRVRLGPIGSVTQADEMLQELIGIGQTNARIVVD